MSVDEFCFMVENDVKIQNIPFGTNGSEKIQIQSNLVRVSHSTNDCM